MDSGFSDFPVDSFGDGLANDEDMLNYFLSSGIGEGFDELGAGSGAAGAGAGAGAQAYRGRGGSADHLMEDHTRSDSFDEVMARVDQGNVGVGGVGGRGPSQSDDLFDVDIASGISPNVLMYPGSNMSPQSSDLSSQSKAGSDLGRDRGSSGFGIPLPGGVSADLGLGLGEDNAPPFPNQSGAGDEGMKKSASSVMISSFGAASLSGQSADNKPKAKRGGGKRRSRKQISAAGGAPSQQSSARKAGSSDSNSKGLTAEEKKIRRLARNRESARQSRRRKKQYLELLEDKVEQLTHEVSTASKASRTGAKRAAPALGKQHCCWPSSLKVIGTPAMASNPGVERTLKQNIAVMKKRFGPIHEYPYSQPPL